MKKRNLNGAFGCLLVIVLIMICAGTITFTLDNVCYAGLTQRMPIYPGAEIVNEEHNMFRQFGMGNTTLTLITPDDQDTVRAWYAGRNGTWLRQSLQSDDPSARLLRTFSQYQFDVSEAPGGVGSQVILFGTCVS